MTSTSFIPRVTDTRPDRARSAAVLALLKTSPSGTEVIFDEVTVPAGGGGKAQAGASARALSFRKHFDGRDGLSLHVRTKRVGNLIRSYVSAEKASAPAPVGTQPVVSYVQKSGSGSYSNGATGTAAVITVTAAPAADPKPRKAKKTGKRKYVRRTESFARHLETGDLLARGYFLPRYKTSKVVTAWPFNSASVSKETLQRRAYSHAQQLNKLAAGRPFKFVVKTSAASVRINVVLTD